MGIAGEGPGGVGAARRHRSVHGADPPVGPLVVLGIGVPGPGGLVAVGGRGERPGLGAGDAFAEEAAGVALLHRHVGGHRGDGVEPGLHLVIVQAAGRPEVQDDLGRQILPALAGSAVIGGEEVQVIVTAHVGGDLVEARGHAGHGGVEIDIRVPVTVEVRIGVAAAGVVDRGVGPVGEADGYVVVGESVVVGEGEIEELHVAVITDVVVALVIAAGDDPAVGVGGIVRRAGIRGEPVEYVLPVGGGAHRQVGEFHEHLVDACGRGEHSHGPHVAGSGDEDPAARVLPVRESHVVDEDEIAVERDRDALVPGFHQHALCEISRPGKDFLAHNASLQQLVVDKPGCVGWARHSSIRGGREYKNTAQQLQGNLPFEAYEPDRSLDQSRYTCRNSASRQRFHGFGQQRDTICSMEFKRGSDCRPRRPARRDRPSGSTRRRASSHPSPRGRA